MIERLFIGLGKGPSIFFMSPQMNRKLRKLLESSRMPKIQAKSSKKSMSVSQAKLALEEKYIYIHPQDFSQNTSKSIHCVQLPLVIA